MKKVLFIVLQSFILSFLIISCQFSNTGRKQSDNVKKITKSFDTGTGILTISGTGSIIESDLDSDQYEKNDINGVIVESGITSIGESTFQGYSNMSFVKIPNSVISIGEYAFSCCHNLNSIFVETGNTVYDSRDNCNAIIRSATNSLEVGCNNTIIPNSVTSIGNGAFSGCDKLVSMKIPSSVTSIGEFAFYRCDKLASIDIPNSVTSIGACAFHGCLSLASIEIPNSITWIGQQAFYDCTSLASIKIPNSVTSIGTLTFYGCDKLASIEIPSSVTSIGEFAFEGCDKLASIDIPNSVTSIGECAFYGCSSLTSIKIPSSVTSIEDYAFSGCSSLTSIDIPNSVTSIGEDAFSGCHNLSSIKIPNSVTTIRNNSFRDSGIVSILIPKSVSYIEDNAFENCSNLDSIGVEFGNIFFDSRENCNAIIKRGTNVMIVGCKNTIIPSSVTSIGDYAFYGSGIDSLEIPKSVTSIGKYAFYGSCIKSIEIPKSVNHIGYKAFESCNNLVSIIVDPDNEVYDSRKNCNAIIKSKTNSIEIGCKNTIIPNSVTSIGESAFRGSCMDSIEIPKSVTSIGEYAFYGSCIKSIEIPKSVNHIGYNAFGSCNNLVSIIVDPDNEVYDSRKNCNAIIKSKTNSIEIGCKNTIIPNSVTSIEESAFENCSNLTSIKIPNSVTSIGHLAFGNCSSLKFIYCQPTTPPICAWTTFGNTGDCNPDWPSYEDIDITVYVPFGHIQTYKEAEGWSYLNIKGKEINESNFDSIGE